MALKSKSVESKVFTLIKIMKPNLLLFVKYINLHKEFTNLGIASDLKIPQSTLNHWIKFLEAKRFLVFRRDGKYKWYRLR